MSSTPAGAAAMASPFSSTSFSSFKGDSFSKERAALRLTIEAQASTIKSLEHEKTALAAALVETARARDAARDMVSTLMAQLTEAGKQPNPFDKHKLKELKRLSVSSAGTDDESEDSLTSPVTETAPPLPPRSSKAISRAIAANGSNRRASVMGRKAPVPVPVDEVEEDRPLPPPPPLDDFVSDGQVLEMAERRRDEIETVIGLPLDSIANNKDGEVATFRATMKSIRMDAATVPIGPKPRLSTVHLTTMPETVLLRVHVPMASRTKTVSAKAEFRPLTIISNLYGRDRNLLPLDSTADEWVLKIIGRREYLFGDYPIIDFEYVRECLKYGRKIRLVIAPASEIACQAESAVEIRIADSLSAALPRPPAPLTRPPFDADAVSRDALLSSPSGVPDLDCVPASNVLSRFGVRMNAIEGLPGAFGSRDVTAVIYAVVKVVHGGTELCPAVVSARHQLAVDANPRPQERLRTSIRVRDLPRAAILSFSLLFENAKSLEPVPIGWANIQLYEYNHALRQGTVNLRLWPDEVANPIGTCLQNRSPEAVVVSLSFDSYVGRVVYPDPPLQFVYGLRSSASTNDIDLSGLGGGGGGGGSASPAAVGASPIAAADGSGGAGEGGEGEGSVGTGSLGPSSGAVVAATAPRGEALTTLERVINADPLYELTFSERVLVWKWREWCSTRPQALPSFVQSVQWNVAEDVWEAERLIADWARPSPLQALQLLDANVAVESARTLAVRCLSDLPGHHLINFLLQLVQVLKYELYHDSALARFLLSRSLADAELGHALFWYLKSEMHVSTSAARLGLLLHEYLMGIGSRIKPLLRQIQADNCLFEVAESIKRLKADQRNKAIADQLSAAPLPESFILPLDPGLCVSGVRVNKCKFMDSKKVPLWLVFENEDAEGPDVYVMYKAGDDLRQDMLTLQMIRIMDNLWLEAGLDLRMNAYSVVATGDETGMIQIVLDSDTTANIQRDQGGARGAFKETPIFDWLRAYNKTEEKMELAVENFVRSCAGYCVATYVLGIGDRHNDNIMVTKDGRLFHIDFGHFLGNIKRKFGIKRERAPFVFTPDFAYVMGGKDSGAFERFTRLCCEAYNILRTNAPVFINLFRMMLSTGIPELRSAADIAYLREAFLIGEDDDTASLHFRNLIENALSSKATRLNNFVHIAAH